MFNMKLVGMKISEYRKAKNLTQMELADMLNVSHQAISNWERGETMPDIAKLPELATIFNTTIDQILNSEKGVTIINHVMGGQKIEKVTMEEFKNVSPILKPSQADELSNDIEVESFDDLISILPFISQKIADQYVVKILDKLNKNDSILSILPFISQHIADQLVSKQLDMNGRIDELHAILPFVSSTISDKLVLNVMNTKGVIENFTSILPFISENMADLVVTQYITHHEGIENLTMILPFVSQKCADQLVLKVMENDGKLPSHVLPFISSELAEQLILRRK